MVFWPHSLGYARHVQSFWYLVRSCNLCNSPNDVDIWAFQPRIFRSALKRGRSLPKFHSPNPLRTRILDQPELRDPACTQLYEFLTPLVRLGDAKLVIWKFAKSRPLHRMGQIQFHLQVCSLTIICNDPRCSRSDRPSYYTTSTYCLNPVGPGSRLHPARSFWRQELVYRREVLAYDPRLTYPDLDASQLDAAPAKACRRECCK